MNWKNILLIFKREVRDQLRDRRTLFMVTIMPVLLYPLLGVGMMQMLLLFSAQARTVVILGANDLPPGLLKADSFDPDLFDNPEDAAKLKVIRDSQYGSIEDGTLRSDQLDEKGASPKELITSARKLQNKYLQWQQNKDPLVRKALKKEMNDLFATTGIDTLVIVPPQLQAYLNQMNEQLHQREENIGIEWHGEQPRLAIIHNSANEKSRLAYSKVRGVTRKWEQQLLRQRLQIANLPTNIMTPVQPVTVDLANANELSANLWSKLFPALLVIMTVTGAFYPAIDVGAGEKERGTMETLLICPATRTEIVLGKFMTVMTFSMSTALLNLISMGFTGQYMASATGGSLSHLGNISPPSLQALLWVGVLMVPLATLFSALCLALSSFARSTKEGQHYLTPLLLIVMGLTVFCISPGIEITPFFSILPVVGPALLLKELLASNGQSLGYVIPVLGASIGYSMLAIWWAIDQFSKEDILFGDAEMFDLKTWSRNLMTNKKTTPTFGLAAFCFVLMMLLQLGSLKIIPAIQATGRFGTTDLLMLQQFTMIATPALLLGLLLTTSVRQTFRFNMPPAKMWGVAALLAVVLHPVSAVVLESIQGFFPQLPESAVKELGKLFDPNMPHWKLILAAAITPAICEEIAFRGFILSGFSRTGRVGIAIVLSSVLFGLFHMIPIQVFNASLLGLVLGLIAIRSNSLFPCMLFHAIYNSLGVSRSWVQPENFSVTGWKECFFTYRYVFVKEENKSIAELHYNLPLFFICFTIAALLLSWLIIMKSPADKNNISEASHLN